MGMGPIPAVRKALDKIGLKVSDIDYWELNEAFASQAMICIRELGIDPAQGTDALLAQAGELIIGGRLYTAAPATSAAPQQPSTICAAYRLSTPRHNSGAMHQLSSGLQ